MGIDPINSHASYFGKSTGSNKRSVPINRTVSSNWNQRVCRLILNILLIAPERRYLVNKQFLIFVRADF